MNDLKVDFAELSNVIDLLRSKGYIKDMVGWLNPIIDKNNFINIPKFEDVDLLSPVKNMEE